jgi:hypothetical protein
MSYPTHVLSSSADFLKYLYKYVITTATAAAAAAIQGCGTYC